MIRRFRLIAFVAFAAAAASAYLYDPAWTANVTSGMREWEEDPPGTRFRWTSGHASFFVDGDGRSVTLPLRAAIPLNAGQPPVVVSVSVDDRWLTDVELKDADRWMRPTLPLPPARGWRRHRRIDLRVSRVSPYMNLGVQVGQPIVRP